MTHFIFIYKNRVECVLCFRESGLSFIEDRREELKILRKFI